MDVYKVYYIPFDVNFYVPMLMNQIEEKAHKKVEVKSKVISTFIKQLEIECKTKNKNDRLDIRVKVMNSENELYISRDQNFIYNGNRCELSLDSKREFISYIIDLINNK